MTRTSNALDLESGLFIRRSARGIALTLKRSARASSRREPDPSRERKAALDAAMAELHKAIGRS